MRGRLINPFFADLAQLDVAATAGDPDGAGPLASGYDTDFRETVVVPDGTWRGYDARREHLVRVPCQIEVQGFGTLEEILTGNSPRSRLVLVFHFADLERMQLVDPTTGEARIRVNDRLVAIREMHTAKLIQAIRTPPGLYITEAQPQFAMGRRRNLLACTFEARALGSKGGAA